MGRFVVVLLAIAVAGCDGEGPPPAVDGGGDAAPPDAAVAETSGPVTATSVDAPAADGPAIDRSDVAARDGASPDAATPDATIPDAAAPACGATGQACCPPAMTCLTTGLTCLPGGRCSCARALYGHYLVRVDGKVLLEAAPPSTVQTPILDAATGRPLAGVVEVQEGASHACALLDGGVWCWREIATGNSAGQLGNGPPDGSGPLYRATPVLLAPEQPLTGVVAIASGASSPYGTNTSCAVTQDGKAYCWGSLTWVTANGSLTSAGYATPITADGSTALTGVVQIAVASTFACALLQAPTAHEVWCWGQNAGESLGLGDIVKHPYPTRVVGLASPTRLALLHATACAIDGGNVRCWGYNFSGETGVGNKNHPIHAPTVVTVMGGAALTGVTDLRAGSDLDASGGGGNFCALLTGGTMSCWGQRFHEYASAFNAANVVSPGAADGNLTRYLTGDGVYHIGATTRAPDCGLLQ